MKPVRKPLSFVRPITGGGSFPGNRRKVASSPVSEEDFSLRPALGPHPADASGSVTDTADPAPSLSAYGRPRLRRAVLALLVFVLLRECMEPVLALSGIDRLPDRMVFYAALGSLLLLDVLPIGHFMRSIGKIAAALIAVGWLFHGVMPGPGWIAEYSGILAVDFALAQSGQWQELSLESRTMLFLAGWAMLGSVLRWLTEHSRRPLWLPGAVLACLLLLHLVPGADTAAGIVRAAAAGLILAAFQRPASLAGLYPTAGSAGSAGSRPVWPPGWLGGSFALAAACLAVGLWAAKDQPRAVKPPDWNRLSRMAEALLDGGTGPDGTASYRPYGLSVGGRTARTGYDGDDSLLGGPIRPDDGVAFTALTSRLTYWRGETKTFYTGRGWMNPASGEKPMVPDSQGYILMSDTVGESRSGSRNVTEPVREDGFRTGQGSQTVPIVGLPDNAEDGSVHSATAGAENPQASGSKPPRPELAVQEVKLGASSPAGRLFAGGDIVKIDSLVTGQGTKLPSDAVAVDARTSSYTVSGGPERMAAYRVVAVLPAADPALLRQAGTEYPEEVASSALQLPTGLTDRVRELALQVTAGKDNPYDKARAVEEYLKNNYRYSMDKAKLLKDGADFTEDFLFRTKTGYCDYFSTAMTVMLRTVGVPARWVKGYGPGETVPAGSEPTGRPSRLEAAPSEGVVFEKIVREGDDSDDTTAVNEPSGPASGRPVGHPVITAPTGAESAPPLTEPSPPVRVPAEESAAAAEAEAGIGASSAPGKPEAEAGTGASSTSAKPESEAQANAAKNGTAARYAVTVRNRDAHSWVEVYFPGAGWVPFDPTPGQAAAASVSDASENSSRLAARLDDMVSALRERLDGFLISLYLSGLPAKLGGWKDRALSGPATISALACLLLLILAFRLRRVSAALVSGRRAAIAYTAVGAARPGDRELERIWRRVYRLYGKRLSGQTAREYAESREFARPGSREAMVELVRLTEETGFGPEPLTYLSKKRLGRLLKRIKTGNQG